MSTLELADAMQAGIDSFERGDPEPLASLAARACARLRDPEGAARAHRPPGTRRWTDALAGARERAVGWACRVGA